MNKKESLLAETINWVLQNPQSVKIFTELKKALDSYEIEQNYWQPLFDLMYNEHGLTLLESEMKDILYVVKKMEGPSFDLSRSIIDKILNVGKPVYSEAELLIINDSINRHMNKEIKDDSYISMKSNKLISKEEHENEWKENVE